jgi:DNA transformation protein
MRAHDLSLTDLPNIGDEVAGLLVKAGIHTTAALRRAGAIQAAERIAMVRPEDPPCRSMLAGLEGAIRGIRWHAIPRTEREALWLRYTMRAGRIRVISARDMSRRERRVYRS